VSFFELGPLREELLRFARSVSPVTVRRVARTLDRSESVADAKARILALPASGARSAALALIAAWQDRQEIDGPSLALALEAAHAAYRERETSESVELAWTGPDTPQIPSRRTDQVLYGLIRDARQHLLIVTFAAYKVDRVAESLRNASDRGVCIDLVLESSEQSAGKVGFDAVEALSPLPDGVAVYHWPLAKRQLSPGGGHGALHAKCAVADERTAFVSSANLTGYALEHNMELGIVIRGGDIPKRIAHHFRELIVRRVLEPVDA
jgi:cardiolipin synthase A/B